VLQALLSPVLIDHDLLTLEPNIRGVVDVKRGIPGIHGPQLITTDVRGFRTTKKIDYASNDSIRIFAIGASTTAQVYIDDRNTWTNILQQSLEQKYGTNVEVINTGVAGLRADNHLATLRNIARLHADVAIFLVGINDWNRHITSHFSPPLSGPQSFRELVADFRRKLDLRNTLLGNAIQRFHSAQVESAQVEERISDEFGEYYAHQRGSLDRKTKYSFKPTKVMEAYDRSMQEISGVCKQYNIKCMFITQPTVYQEYA
jgi:lysophospholipase L1-like esterase